MTPVILLYSLRAHGYVYPNGTYGTQINDARRFTGPEAIEYAKRHINHEGASILIPINLSILNEIQEAS